MKRPHGNPGNVVGRPVRHVPPFCGMTRSRTMDATIQGLRLPEGFAGMLEDNGLPLPPLPLEAINELEQTDEWFFATDGREPLSGLAGLYLEDLGRRLRQPRSAARPQGRPPPLSWLRAPRRGAPELAVPLSAGCGPPAPRAVASVGGRMERSRNGTPVP